MQSALDVWSSSSGAAQPVQVNKALDMSPHGKSNAAAATVDIVKAVKSAVAEGLRIKNQDNKADASVMIFRLPESKNDLAKVRRLLEDDVQFVIKVHRLGKPPSAGQHTSGQLSRPIKVQLKSANDKNWVVCNAKELAKASGNSSIRIAKYRTSAELDKVKKLRQDCSSLSMSSFKLPNGKSRYLVIDSHIMH